jgi:hypothetical protein
MAAGDDATAASSCQRILEIDPNDSPSRAVLASLKARQGDVPCAEAQLTQLKDSKAAAPYIASVKQAIADQALRDGNYDKALTLYESLSNEPVEEDQRRTLQVKTLATRAAKSGTLDGERQAELLFELLVGEPGQRSDPASSVYLSRELRPLRQDGLAEYLEGRQLFFQGRYGHAAELFGHASGKSLPTDELTAEALRTEAISRLAIAQLDRAATLFQAFAKTGNAHKAEADDYLARIRFMQGHTDASGSSSPRPRAAR